MNILFITADQWRGDCTGYAGHPLVKTPNLDELASQGVAFLNHYAQAAPCSPARASLYTGLYQMNNRVCRNGSPLADRFDNIAKAARRAGYDPTLFGYTDVSPDPTVHHENDPDLTTYEGDLPGFTTRVKLPEHEKAWLSWLRQQGLELGGKPEADFPVGVEPGTVSNAPPAYSAEQTQTAFIANEFVRWLGEQDGDRYWFAHLSFIRPHPPFIVPAPYNTMFSSDEVGDFVRAGNVTAEGARHPLMEYALQVTTQDSFVPGASGRVADWTTAEFKQIKATYFGMIAEVDAQLGRVFQAIRDRGEWEQTIIVFTSDHAEMMGDHYTLGKGGYFDQSQHIPLIVRRPGEPEGATIEVFTESVDVFPTLLELLEAQPLHHPDGRSLVPLLWGDPPDDWRDEVHWEFDFRDVVDGHAEGWFGLKSNELNLAVIRTDRWKYVHFPKLPPLLFDLQADPGCLQNLADDPRHVAERIEMAERLLAWRARHLDQTLALKMLTPDGVVTGRV
ncbi:alkaline phosphatase family protein [Devosia sp. CN2-171]|uniref:alkaline phosphatase family protein n=1 Tax=Devosia sp. CN2-171 TaxID=3400909 RepID=UPI003BF80EB9